MIWYSVVTFGSPTEGVHKGRSVTRDLDSAWRRAAALRAAQCPTVRIVECQTRAQARNARIQDDYPVIAAL